MDDLTPHVDPEQLDGSRFDSATVVDVRELHEYRAGHLPGSLLMPMEQFVSRMGELDPSSPIYVVCTSGNRSAAVADLLICAGYDAYSMAGGIAAWTRAGRPLESGPPSAR